MTLVIYARTTSPDTKLVNFFDGTHGKHYKKSRNATFSSVSDHCGTLRFYPAFRTRNGSFGLSFGSWYLYFNWEIRERAPAPFIIVTPGQQ